MGGRGRLFYYSRAEWAIRLNLICRRIHGSKIFLTFSISRVFFRNQCGAFVFFRCVFACSAFVFWTTKGGKKSHRPNERQVSLKFHSPHFLQKKKNLRRFYHRRIRQNDFVLPGKWVIWEGTESIRCDGSPRRRIRYWRRVERTRSKYSVVGRCDEIKTCVKLFFIEHDTRIYKCTRRGGGSGGEAYIINWCTHECTGWRR